MYSQRIANNAFLFLFSFKHDKINPLEELTMFLMMGINSKQEQLDYNQTMICPSCGQYGRYIVYMTYTVFSLFFIPLFKWNKKYYVETSCCHSTYQLSEVKGKNIENGLKTEILQSDLYLLQKNFSKHCSNCGYTTNQDFDYCPNCGHKF